MLVESRDLFKVYDDDAVSLVRNSNGWDIVLGGKNTGCGIAQDVIESMKRTKRGQLYPVENHIQFTINAIALEMSKSNIDLTEQAQKNLYTLIMSLL